MTSLVTTLSASVISALVSAIWQGALLALCVALILKLLPGISAAARSTLWLIAFALAVALHFVPASLGAPSGSASASRALHAAPAWSFALALAWAAAVALPRNAVHGRRAFVCARSPAVPHP